MLQTLVPPETVLMIQKDVGIAAFWGALIGNIVFWAVRMIMRGTK